MTLLHFREKHLVVTPQLFHEEIIKQHQTTRKPCISLWIGTQVAAVKLKMRKAVLLRQAYQSHPAWG